MTSRTTATALRLLLTALSVFMPVPRDTEADPRQGGLPRLEFEAPPAAVDRSGPVLVPGTLRGVMGYRLPLVSRQVVPGQVVSGVLIPTHTTYVILQPGYWELVGLSPADVEALRAAAAAAKAAEPAVPSAVEVEPSRGWNPLRLFRKPRTSASKE